MADEGYTDRGYLPHLHHPGMVQFVTFRLADSLPATFDWASVEAAPAHTRQRLVENRLDESHGGCCLRQPRAAAAVVEVLRHFDQERYRLIAWVVMPNHVHVVVEPLAGLPLATIVAAWKRASAHGVNAALGRSGQLWQREYFDRFVRDDRHLRVCVDYAHNNPVKAGLAETPEAWPWSSAHLCV